MIKMTGEVETHAWERATGRHLWTKKNSNLAVDGASYAIARLLSVHNAPYAIRGVGFGSGTGAPATTDTGLTPPSYFKSVPAGTLLGTPYPTLIAPTQLRFIYNLNADAVKDYGANNINVQEVCLLVNPIAAQLPRRATLRGLAEWVPSHVYSAGDVMYASDQSLTVVWEVTGGGTSGVACPDDVTFGGTINNTGRNGTMTVAFRAVVDIFNGLGVPLFPASTPVHVGEIYLVAGSPSHIFVCTVAGTTGSGFPLPPGVGNTIISNSAVFLDREITLSGSTFVPGPGAGGDPSFSTIMVARVLQDWGFINPSIAFSSTWTITCVPVGA